MSSLFSWLSRYILFLVKLKRSGRPFLEGARRGGHIVRLPQEHLVVIKDAKVCPFVKFEKILPLLCYLLDHLINKCCMAWSSIINLWIDYMTCQKYRILLSARQRSNNYLELSKEKVMENMMLSHWPCFTWKIFMIWFHKILELIFSEAAIMYQKYMYSAPKKITCFHSFLRNCLIP